MNKSPKTILLLYVLLSYVVLQFSWWAYLIYDLNVSLIEFNSIFNETPSLDKSAEVRRQLTMILGEGTVFLSLLLVGAYYIRKFIIREHKLAKQERNFLLATTHEFNSPIAAIRLNLQTIGKRELNEDQKQQMVSGALSAAQRLESLVSNLLTAARIDSGKFEVLMEEFNLSKLIATIGARMETICLENGGSIVYHVREDLIIRADQRAMELIIENLLSNAIKYAPGSRIEISAKFVSHILEIIVADYGPGIPRDEQKQIFKKFYRIENEETRSQKGTGLGLYLVKELVNAQGGIIQYIPNTPKGSIFQINIDSNQNK